MHLYCIIINQIKVYVDDEMPIASYKTHGEI